MLLEMTPDLLKELGISTFGKRFRLHSAIKMLRDRMPPIEETVSGISTLVIQLMLISNVGFGNGAQQHTRRRNRKQEHGKPYFEGRINNTRHMSTHAQSCRSFGCWQWNPFMYG